MYKFLSRLFFSFFFGIICFVWYDWFTVNIVMLPANPLLVGFICGLFLFVVFWSLEPQQ